MFIAEPVGSCTDLVATVTYPLRRIYGDDFFIAPLSVLVDPIRALRIFGLEEGGKFSEKVLYIYRKQLEEADIVVINKCDVLDASKRQLLRGELATQFPRAEIFEVSARSGAGLGPWFDRITAAEQTARAAMEVNYELYAEGEALLGWLNCTVRLQDRKAFDANAVLEQLAGAIQERLDIFRFQRERGLIARQRLVEAAEREQRIAAVVERTCTARIDGKRFFH